MIVECYDKQANTVLATFVLQTTQLKEIRANMLDSKWEES